MNLFTRISATLSASADKAVSQFENHEAIADSALLQARQAMAKARVRHATLQRTGNDLQTRIDKQQTQITQWTERAIKLASVDETKALECLEHKQRCEQTLTSLNEAFEQHQVLEANMQQKLNSMELRLQSMMRQRDTMRSRESVAKAHAVMDRIGPDGKDAVDAVFERWETSICDTELQSESYLPALDGMSTLEHELLSEERKLALKNELEQLVGTSGDSDANA